MPRSSTVCAVTTIGIDMGKNTPGIDGMADNSAWPDRAVKPRSRVAARRRRGA
jgi:hypothetical protein